MFPDAGGTVLAEFTTGDLTTSDVWVPFSVTGQAPTNAVTVETRISGSTNFGVFINAFWSSPAV